MFVMFVGGFFAAAEMRELGAHDDHRLEFSFDCMVPPRMMGNPMGMMGTCSRLKTTRSP
jgi:hypothetical protein